MNPSDKCLCLLNCLLAPYQIMTRRHALTKAGSSQNIIAVEFSVFRDNTFELNNNPELQNTKTFYTCMGEITFSQMPIRRSILLDKLPKCFPMFYKYASWSVFCKNCCLQLSASSIMTHCVRQRGQKHAKNF